jgi:hypothetical protein
MTTLTTAELRGYQQISENGSIMVIACDQRGGIRKIWRARPRYRRRLTPCWATPSRMLCASGKPGTLRAA